MITKVRSSLKHIDIDIIETRNYLLFSGETHSYSPVRFGDVLQEVTNKQQAVSRRRLSDVLKLPPTPRRSTKHRNYAKPYQPVLTAGERLEEIRKKEGEKLEKEQQRKRKAVEREEAKLKREEVKKAKMEERERKKLEKKPKITKPRIKSKRTVIRD